MTAALTAAELEAINRPPGTATGLPNRFYVSAEAVEAERDSVLSFTWTGIGFASDLLPSQARPVSPGQRHLRIRLKQPTMIPSWSPS